MDRLRTYVYWVGIRVPLQLNGVIHRYAAPFQPARGQVAKVRHFEEGRFAIEQSRAKRAGFKLVQLASHAIETVN